MATAKRLWPLANGMMNIDESFCHLGGKGTSRIPLPCFLIEHADGLVLFDTGLDPDAWEVGTQAIYGPVNELFPMECPPGNRLDQKLEQAGFKVTDVTHVVMSHLHADHTGGIRLFPHAKFYVSAEELQAAYWPPHPFFAGWCPTKDVESIPRSCWNTLTGDLDLFGDGSMQILRAPGHTPGHNVMMVKLPSRTFMLAADLGHTEKNIEGIPCPADLDITTSWRSIERIKQISAANKADLWVFHDVGDWEKWGNVDQPYS